MSAHDVAADAIGSSELIDTNELTRRIVAARVLDALREAGFAVVELPEPTAVDDDGQVFFGEYDIRADPTGSPQYRGVTTDFGLGTEAKQTFSVARARWWGVALLAAANAVEVES